MRYLSVVFVAVLSSVSWAQDEQVVPERASLKCGGKILVTTGREYPVDMIGFDDVKFDLAVRNDPFRTFGHYGEVLLESESPYSILVKAFIPWERGEWIERQIYMNSYVLRMDPNGEKRVVLSSSGYGIGFPAEALAYGEVGPRMARGKGLRAKVLFSADPIIETLMLKNQAIHFWELVEKAKNQIPVGVVAGGDVVCHQE